MFALMMLTFALCSCVQFQSFDVPGHDEFVMQIKAEYEYVIGFRYYMSEPTTFFVRCMLTREVPTESMEDLIELLKDYALTTVRDAFRETFITWEDDNHIFLEFYVGEGRGTFHSRYRYREGGIYTHEWKLE